MSELPAYLAAGVGLLALLALLWPSRSSRTVAGLSLPTAAQAAYEADPAARATCEHLRPIENEAREQGIDCLLDEEGPASIFIRALDPGPKAMAPLRLASCVRHEESRVIGPHTSSDPTYRCTHCASSAAFHQGGYGNDPPPLPIRDR